MRCCAGFPWMHKPCKAQIWRSKSPTPSVRRPSFSEDWPFSPKERIRKPFPRWVRIHKPESIVLRLYEKNGCPIMLARRYPSMEVENPTGPRTGMSISKCLEGFAPPDGFLALNSERPRLRTALALPLR